MIKPLVYAPDRSMLSSLECETLVKVNRQGRSKSLYHVEAHQKMENHSYFTF